MASNNSTPPKSPLPQSIPLQDLARPPDSVEEFHRSREHSRINSRSQRTPQYRSILGRNTPASNYARLAADSPTRLERPTVSLSNYQRPGVTTPGQEYLDEPPSPLDDVDGFALATASAGLSFDPSPPTQSPITPPHQINPRLSVPSSSARGRLDRLDSNESENFFLPNDNDTTPLTNTQYLEPRLPNTSSTLRGQRHDRLSKRSSVHWGDGGSPGPSSERATSHLGDDLPHLEPSTTGGRERLSVSEGRRSSRSRSLSPSPSPISRANSMLRMISQRVVNLSNDTDMVEQGMRRKSSIRHARQESTVRRSEDRGETYELDAENPVHPSTPMEKVREPSRLPPDEPVIHFKPSNPLKGKSWGIFGPENKLRTWLREILIHPITEPIILVLIIAQTVLLAVSSAPDAVYHRTRAKRWGSTGLDWALLGLFILYTLEIVARSIVSGFILNPPEYSTIDRSKGFVHGVVGQAHKLFSLQREAPERRSSTDEPAQPSIVRTFTGRPDLDAPGHGRQQQRIRLARRAFLRHSFNRLDLVAVVSYWISFGMQIGRFEMGKHVYVFNMLSCLRILRLLGLTSGTSIILRSLKKAAPLLVNVAFLISFFWLLFAIVGVQSFKSSLRRTCVWVNPDPNGLNYTQNIAPENVQFCGGHLDNITGLPMPWVMPDGRNGTGSHKGYLCPQGSLCVEGTGPYNGTVGFDNIFQSLELVFVVMSSNTFSDLLYYLTQSDYLAAALFFAGGIVIMSFWLINLLVAVITSSFQIIREESQQSAFTTENIDEEPVEEGETIRSNTLKRLFDKTYWVWILVIAYSLVVQCLRSATMGPDRESFIMNSETVVTLILLLEIVLRFLVDWRNFFRSKSNLVDLALAIATSVIQIPSIRNSGQTYAWLTFFQIARIYRLVLAVRVTRELVMIVFGNIVGLLNLIVFVFLVTFLAAILACQLFRGDFPVTDPAGNVNYITFDNIYNSFLGMYQVLSSENWTTLMYNATQFDLMWNTAWLGAVFFIMWFVFANFVVLNMFIAVIQESFDVTEDEKRLQQVKAFLRQKEVSGTSQGNLSLSSILRFGKQSIRHRDALEYGAATLEQLLKDAVVKDFLDEQPDEHEHGHGHGHRPVHMPTPITRAPTFIESGIASKIWAKIIGIGGRHEPNPFFSHVTFTRANEEFDARAVAKQVVSATENRRRAQRQYLTRHPRYNVALFLFKPNNPLRRLCQYVVGPGRGNERIEGVAPWKPVWYSFSAFIYASIVVMVVLACVTTPLYQREYYLTHSLSIRNWFVWTDMGFAGLFTIEAIIKVIADGFFFTPNAYFRGTWGFIDGIVLITLWINVATSLFSDTGVSRAVGAFKALRALRLLNVSDSARETFHSVIIVGGYKVISAAFVSMSLLIPFAILGLNLFNGQLSRCNDSGFPYSQLSDCVGEWNSTPFNWPVLAPRQVGNPAYNFDDFGSSLFILFQIVSEEGWVDVMFTTMGITGRGLQPKDYVSQGNAVFFVIFNLLASVFVLTLFVSVFMRNYTEQTGVAFLTAEQRSWLELRKLLKQISPSKRSLHDNSQKWQKWCYRLSVQKHGLWHRFITATLICHLILLMIEFYPSPTWWDRTRQFLFIAFTAVFLVNILIRIFGLTWNRFRRRSWDMYSVVAVGGALVISIVSSIKPPSKTLEQLQKSFLVSIAFLLIPRNNQLDILFKTAAASLPLIGNLMATWFVLFLVYAIAFTQAFGLTRFGPNENVNLNFRDVPKALILLFRMSCGEGWNSIMEDFATINPPFCVRGDNFFQSDCGSGAWAKALFISWNIISMYIFVSLFVSLIFESFSYVYQRSSGMSIISREQIRRFKHAWSDFDPDGTGYISKEAFPRLLGELSGVFQMRIYEGDFMIRRLVEDCSVQAGDPMNKHRRIVEGIDLDKLNERLNMIPFGEIKQRRAKMSVFYQEILLSADPEKGVSFTSCLMILAHYNVINDTKSLRLEEFLRRRARLQRVHETIRRNTVIGWFDMMYWSRKFRRTINSRSNGRLEGPPQMMVPEIFVDNPDEHLDSSTSTEPHDFTESVPFRSPQFRDKGSPVSSIGSRSLPPIDTGISLRGSLGGERLSFDASPTSSPVRRHHRLQSTDTAYLGPGTSPTTPTFGPQSRSGTSPTTPTFGTHNRDDSTVSAISGHGVMESFDLSAWGESLRRSFTMRRPSQG